MVGFLILALAGISASAAQPDPWAPVSFLVGTWKGTGKDEDATGKGTTTFTWDLGHRVLVRRDKTEYAAAPSHPAYDYEALMIIYRDPTSGEIEANYFDNGDHVIHYKLARAPQRDTAQFVSDAQAGPAFRLTYSLRGSADMTVKFEVKPPGASLRFQIVAAGVVHKA